MSNESRPGPAAHGVRHAGDLELRPLPAVLLDLHEANITGRFLVRRDRVVKTIELYEGQLVATSGKDETLGHFLVASGVIGGYDSPARFLPSRATQRARCASLPEAEELQARLQAAQAGSPLAAGKLGAFVDDVAGARQRCTLNREALAGTSLALAVDALLLPRAAGWSVLLPLHPPAGDPPPEIASGAVRAALAGSDALFIDMKGELDQLYNDYLHEAMLLSLAGFAAIVALLAVALRSARRLAGVLLPLLLAVVLVIAALAAGGRQLHLLHLIGMLLIVAVGSNYALFFDRATVRGAIEPETLASMLVANLTTASAAIRAAAPLREPLAGSPARPRATARRHIRPPAPRRPGFGSSRCRARHRT